MTQRHRTRTWILLTAPLWLAACAGPLPDGSKIDRSPAGIAETGALTPEQARRLEELNAQILREQDAARSREERFEAMQRARSSWEMQFGVGYPWPHRHWHWTGIRWVWRP